MCHVLTGKLCPNPRGARTNENCRLKTVVQQKSNPQPVMPLPMGPRHSRCGVTGELGGSKTAFPQNVVSCVNQGRTP